MRKLSKNIGCLLLAGTFIGSLSPAANAAITQLPNGVIRVYISNRPIAPVAQDTAVWCWAASLSALFGYFGHPVNQERIALRYFPNGPVRTGSPMVMSDALNTVWLDDSGQRFQIRSGITDLYTPTGRREVSNLEIVRALNAEIPVFYGDRTHAMVLVQADYVPSPAGPQIRGGWAIDPWPKPGTREAIGFRQLQQGELQAFFVGIPVAVTQ